MRRGINAPRGYVPYKRRRLSRGVFAQAVAGGLTLAFGGIVSAWLASSRPDGIPDIDMPPAPTPTATPAIAPPVTPATSHARRTTASNVYGALYFPNVYGVLLNPNFSLGATPVPLAQSTPLGSSFASLTPESETRIAEAEDTPSVPVPPVPVPPIGEPEQKTPLPPLRPAALEVPASAGPSRAPDRRHLAQQTTTTIQAATPPDKRSFFQKIFGGSQSSGPALAYAAPEDGILSNPLRGASGRQSIPQDRWTAIYDIAAHTVYMPDGTKLEAHSGLGNRLDDPYHVNERMRGATPPHVYDLRPREQLFHGVQALRLIPVGDGGIYGRTGLLAHSYMLGPNGQSNGCVSFRNYNAFLRAYMNGEIKRLVVVASMK